MRLYRQIPTFLALSLAMTCGCHDLDAIPRVGEVDGSIADASTRDAALTDGGDGGGRALDGSVADAGADMGPLPLIPLSGARFELPFPVRAALPHAEGVLAVGADSGERSVATTRQAVVAHFVDESVDATALGDLQNDQYFALAPHGSDALGVGLVKLPSVTGDNILVTRFSAGAPTQSVRMGTAANEIAFDATVVGDDLVTVGRCGALPCMARVSTSLDGPGVGYSVDVGADGSFLGVREIDGLIVAVGETTSETPRRAIVAAFDAGSDALIWVRAVRFLGADNEARFLDVDGVGGDIVAVGNRGSVGVRAAFDATGTTVAVESVGTQTALFQVGTMGGREHYVGRNEGVLTLGRRSGDNLLFDRLPFDQPNMGGRAAHFGADPFLVAVSETSVYVAPLNADGRASCATAERSQTFESLDEGPDYEISAAGTAAAPEALTVTAIAMPASAESSESLGRACPSTP